MNPELPKFINFTYSPADEQVPGCLTVRYRFEKWSGHEVERGFIFQYLQGKVFFRVYPTLVQLPLGEAASVEEAVELAKQFLDKWLSEDPRYLGFQNKMAREISRLEEEKRREKEAQRKKRRVEYEDLDEDKKRIVDEIMKMLAGKKRGKG